MLHRVRGIATVTVLLFVSAGCEEELPPAFASFQWVLRCQLIGQCPSDSNIREVNHLDGERGHQVECSARQLRDGSRSLSFYVASPEGWSLRLSNAAFPAGGGTMIGTAALTVTDGDNTYAGVVGSGAPDIMECAPPPVDGGTDAGADAETDAAADAGTDAAADAETDAGADAETDAAADAETDAAADAGTDATVDAWTDAGADPIECGVCDGVTQPCQLTGLDLVENDGRTEVRGTLLCLCLPNRADHGRLREVTGPEPFNSREPTSSDPIAFRLLHCEGL